MVSRSPSPSQPPSGPLPIRRLQEALINRIAAGEVSTSYNDLPLISQRKLDYSQASIRSQRTDRKLSRCRL